MRSARARPTEVADVEWRRANFMHEAKLSFSIGRSATRQRHEPRQFRDISRREPDMRETAPMPPERAHFPHRYAGPFVETAQCETIETRFGIDIQRRAAECDQRGNRCRDVDDSRPIQRQLDTLVVLVLLHQSSDDCREHQRGKHYAGAPPKPQTPNDILLSVRTPCRTPVSHRAETRVSRYHAIGD